uniref:Uncharacterized protein n=1 Tax=Chrysemys picta bellii TaxID=8478 RepID=A0A8C3F8B1_CHRPI
MKINSLPLGWETAAAEHRTYFGACVLQVCGVHSCAKCHRARFCLLQVLFHFHKAQLQVNPPALFLFALLIYFLQLLLHISHQAAILFNVYFCLPPHPNRGHILSPTILPTSPRISFLSQRPKHSSTPQLLLLHH